LVQVVGLVDADKLKPGDLVGVNKDSYLVLDMLPAEYDSRVKVRVAPLKLSLFLLHKGKAGVPEFHGGLQICQSLDFGGTQYLQK
jgi:hypothetical protein